MSKIPIRNLLSLIHKRFLQTSTVPSPSPPSSSLTVQYLTKSCGIGLESAIAISQKFQIDEKNPLRSDLFVTLLRTYGFDVTHISKLIEKHPRFLRCQSTTMKPKFEYLVDNGFKGTLLHELIVANPIIILRSLDSKLKPAVEFLKKFLPTDVDLLAAVKRSSWLLSMDTERILQSNVGLLRDEGVPGSSISKQLIRSPRTLCQSYDRIACAVKAIKDMGIEPKSAKFLRALQAYCSMSNLNWEKKLELFKSFGWSKEEVMTAFKNDPLCFACSEQKLRNMMDFYTTTLKLERKAIINDPKLLSYSMDKRVRPRYEIMKLLQSKNLIEKDERILKMLTLSEKKFLAEYITKQKDKVPILLDMYKTSVN